MDVISLDHHDIVIACPLLKVFTQALEYQDILEGSICNKVAISADEMKGLREKSILPVILKSETGRPIKYTFFAHDEVDTIERVNIVKMFDLRHDFINHIASINHSDLVSHRYQNLPHAVVIPHM